MPSKLILQIALFAFLAVSVQPAFAGKAANYNSDEYELYDVLQTQANQRAQQQQPQTPAPPNPAPESGSTPPPPPR
ncbi:MAG: hypothetical protein IPO31_04645 [Candidatus Obscuribacter sp.]|nr:hypothetical protein [Candidatus Obscuribacter sp.]